MEKIIFALVREYKSAMRQVNLDRKRGFKSDWLRGLADGYILSARTIKEMSGV